MNDKVHQPHDTLFKATFTRKESALSFFKGYLPEAVSELMDWQTLTLQASSFIDEELQKLESDLLYSVKLNGKNALLYLLFEAQGKQCQLMPWRLLKYQVRIWEQFLRQNKSAKSLPFILPLVLSHVKGGWKSPVSFVDVLNCSQEALVPYIPDFKYHLIDLGRIPEAQIMGNLTARVTQHLLQAFMAGKIEDFVIIHQNLLEKLLTEQDAMQLLKAYLRYITTVDSKVDPIKFMSKIKLLRNGKLKKETMSIAEKLKTLGRKEGREEGLEKGREEGLEKGREEGLEKGREEGELMGQIMLCQKLLHKQNSTKEALQKQPLEQLKSILKDLKKQLNL